MIRNYILSSHYHIYDEFYKSHVSDKNQIKDKKKTINYQEWLSQSLSIDHLIYYFLSVTFFKNKFSWKLGVRKPILVLKFTK